MLCMAGTLSPVRGAMTLSIMTLSITTLSTNPQDNNNYLINVILAVADIRYSGLVLYAQYVAL
jgi:hypothetical protein